MDLHTVLAHLDELQGAPDDELEAHLGRLADAVASQEEIEAGKQYVADLEREVNERAAKQIDLDKLIAQVEATKKK